MRTASISIIAALNIASVTAQAQTHGHQEHAGLSPAPYAGFDHRKIKSLSDQQIADLRTGRGMGLALAAELNGYPGPLHVLELADAIKLSTNQRSSSKSLLEEMRRETTAIGQRIIAEETELNRLFESRKVTPTNLDDATSRIAVAQGQLRSAHLRYHLLMFDLLSPAQVAAYNRLRGYKRGQGMQHQR